MAVLPEAERGLAHSEFMQANLEGLALTKADLRAAVDALDTFMHTNAAALNTAMPQPARSALSTAQKAHMLMIVIQRRYLTGV